MSPARTAEEGHDGFGRYMIVPTGGGKPVAHTRATTHAKTLDDHFALEQWSERMVALGLSRRPDLLAGVAAARDDDRDRIDALVRDAKAAAEAHKGANIGTALHSFTERLDLGELKLAQVPEPWLANITAYAEMMKREQLHLDVIEAVVVVPELTVAGKLDRIVIRNGRRYILDVKTQQSLYGLATISIQLALYAHAETMYDQATGTHTPMPEVDQQLAFVAHCPAGHGTCELIAVDIDTGWHGALLAQHVRAFRRAKVQRPLPVDRRAWLVGEVKRLVSDFPDAAKDLAAQWPYGVPTLKSEHDHSPEQLESIVSVLQRIEGEHRIPFGEPDPAPMTSNQEGSAAA